MARITVKVHPRARRTRLAGKLGAAYKIELASPPVDGKANAELIALVAEQFGCAKAAVSIRAGATGRMKLVQIATA